MSQKDRLPDFAQWDQILQRTGRGLPCLLLDHARYIANLQRARESLQPGIGVRVVAKSLACLPMLDMALQQLQAVGLMTFSAEMLIPLLQARPEVEHLLGKPLPASVAAQVLDQQPHASKRVIWLVDTQARAQQYAALAQARGVRLRVALELDVGLHRGGVEPKDLAALAALVQQMPMLHLEGVMGYEPHLAKLPAPLRALSRARVEQALRAARALLQDMTGGGAALVNTGGSLTFETYGTPEGVSEVSLGSVLVKPGDFEVRSTQAFEAAMFIATPILKYRANNPIPGLEILTPLTRWRRRAALTIYGGYWKATPVHPKGYGYSGIFGRSSNQEIWSGPALGASPVDHFAFLRPDQSEAVIPEFGEILVLSEGEFTETWPALSGVL